MTIFLTPPDENDDTDEDSTGKEEANPGLVHFSRNMPEAETEMVKNEADNGTLKKRQKHKKGNNISGGKVTWKNHDNVQFLVSKKSEKLII